MMDAASYQFLAFGLAVAFISNLTQHRAWRSVVLFIASIAFLFALAHNPLLLIPLFGFLLLGYGAVFLREHGVPLPLIGSTLVIIFVYIWLKKYTVLPQAMFLHFPYFTLGLSYIFFRVLHLVIEAGDGPESPHIGLGAYLLYTINFTTLVSGPIQRYEEFARDQFASRPLPLGSGIVCLQLERIVRGFFKVNVLAMLFDIVRVDAQAQMTYQLPLPVKMFAAFRLIVVYPLFLYANFSGYIDIVIALARLMRLRLPENFDRPFSASSVLDFWNRWHMTLSNWLKTYLYNPLLLALMRRISSPAAEPFLGVLCFFVTFFLIGVWHGRTSEFIMFGVLTGGGMSINKLWQLGLTRALGRKGYKKVASNAAYVAFGRGLNFTWFGFTFFWFGNSWRQIELIFSSLPIIQWLVVWLAVWLTATVILAMWEELRAALLSVKSAAGPVLTSRYARVVYVSALGLAAFVMTVLLNQPAPGIVYKAF